jgi:L-ectoine synthase
MIVRSLDDILDTDRDVRGEVWASRRFLLAEDGCGFTMTQTTTEAGSDQILWYKNHIEANYVIEGEGEVENMATGEVFPLKPGTMYTLDKNDRHRLKAFTRMRFVCVFTPALTGRETHDAVSAHRHSRFRGTDDNSLPSQQSIRSSGNRQTSVRLFRAPSPTFAVSRMALPCAPDTPCRRYTEDVGRWQRSMTSSRT